MQASAFLNCMLISGLFLLRPSATVGSFVGNHIGKPKALIARALLVKMAGASSESLTGKTCVSLQDALDAHGDPTVKFIDGSWFLGKIRIARDEYQAGPRIAGAQFFDIDDVCAKGPDLNPKALPHMMPPKELFAATMDAMGITNDHSLVVYGSQGCVSAQVMFVDISRMRRFKICWLVIIFSRGLLTRR